MSLKRNLQNLSTEGLKEAVLGDRGKFLEMEALDLVDEWQPRNTTYPALSLLPSIIEEHYADQMSEEELLAMSLGAHVAVSVLVEIAEALELPPTDT